MNADERRCSEQVKPAMVFRNGFAVGELLHLGVNRALFDGRNEQGLPTVEAGPLSYTIKFRPLDGQGPSWYVKFREAKAGRFRWSIPAKGLNVSADTVIRSICNDQYVNVELANVTEAGGSRHWPKAKNAIHRVGGLLEFLGWVALGLSVAGVLLNNFRLWPCFLFWMGSNGLSAYIHRRTGPRSLLVRDLIFLALAALGLWQWTRR